MDFQNYISDQALILIPVIYILGLFLKKSTVVKDKYIPLILLFFGIALSLLLVGLNVQGVIQGILVSGTAVFANQIIKQSLKQE